MTETHPGRVVTRVPQLPAPGDYNWSWHDVHRVTWGAGARNFEDAKKRLVDRLWLHEEVAVAWLRALPEKLNLR